MGGYASRVGQGLAASLGPTAYTIPDPANFSNNSEIPIGQFEVVMDHSSGTVSSTDWYGDSFPTSFDRGVRNSDVINYYDGGDTRPNPSTPPTSPPLPDARWLSPSPDGLGRWVWGDSNFNTGMWIETEDKVGFVTVPSLGCGIVYYGGSTLHRERTCFEFQIFSPYTFGESIEGLRQPWDVKPNSSLVIDLPGMGVGGSGSNSAVAGATYDSTTKRIYVYGLYAYGTYPNNFGNRIYVYQVSDTGSDITAPVAPNGLSVQ